MSWARHIRPLFRVPFAGEEGPQPPPPDNVELREDGGYELRQGGGLELREP